MRLNFHKAIEVFEKAAQVRDDVKAYCLAPDRPDMPIEELKRVIADMYKLKIEVKEVPWEIRSVRGLLLRYADRSMIYVGRNQSEDWKRFTAAKELCHIVNDQSEDWSPRGADTLRELLTEFSIDNTDEADKAAQSEMFAELAAVELLYPYDVRLSDLAKLGSGELTITKIASHHRIPAVLVEQYLSDDRMRIAEVVWDAIQKKKAA